MYAQNWQTVKVVAMWIGMVLFWIALWKVTRPTQKAKKMKLVNKARSWDWLRPYKQLTLIICGWLVLVAFPIVSMMFGILISILIAIGIVLLIVVFGSDLFEGWTIKLDN
jgi:hypothetical protein